MILYDAILEALPHASKKGPFSIRRSLGNDSKRFAIALVALMPGASLACRCPGLSEEAQFDFAKTVFLGKVTSIHIPTKNGKYEYDDSSLNGEHGPTPGPVRIKVQVEDVVKGDAMDIPFIQKGYGNGDCGEVVQVGRTYIFLPDRWGYISICTGEAVPYDPLNKDVVALLDRMRARAKSPRIN